MTNKELIQTLLEYPLHMEVREVGLSSHDMNNNTIGAIKMGISPTGDHVILIHALPF